MDQADRAGVTSFSLVGTGIAGEKELVANEDNNKSSYDYAGQNTSALDKSPQVGIARTFSRGRVRLVRLPRFLFFVYIIWFKRFQGFADLFFNSFDCLAVVDTELLGIRLGEQLEVEFRGQGVDVTDFNLQKSVFRYFQFTGDVSQRGSLAFSLELK